MSSEKTTPVATEVADRLRRFGNGYEDHLSDQECLDLMLASAVNDARIHAEVVKRYDDAIELASHGLRRPATYVRQAIECAEEICELAKVRHLGITFLPTEQHAREAIEKARAARIAKLRETGALIGRILRQGRLTLQDAADLAHLSGPIYDGDEEGLRALLDAAV